MGKQSPTITAIKEEQKKTKVSKGAPSSAGHSRNPRMRNCQKHGIAYRSPDSFKRRNKRKFSPGVLVTISGTQVRCPSSDCISSAHK